MSSKGTGDEQFDRAVCEFLDRTGRGFVVLAYQGGSDLVVSSASGDLIGGAVGRALVEMIKAQITPEMLKQLAHRIAELLEESVETIPESALSLPRGM